MKGSRPFCSLILAAALVPLASAVCSGQSGLSQKPARVLPPQVFDMEPYDDVLELEAEELSNYLNFEGSRLNPIVRVKVSCYCKTKIDHAAKALRYQDLWFRHGDAIGLKEYAPLPAEDGDRVALLIKPRFKPYNEAEIAACSAALVRLRLALSLNRNMIETVRVPGLTLEAFVDALRKQHFVPYKELRKHVDVLIPIPLESENGSKVVSCFSPDS
ncbi:MAG: hypothetical protein JSS83_12390 [Cyanobacteria bacterium SZAS LIN-3]|nr:hypothetical protein [Cyanobacteria bacterium SZAS LIN-3]